MTDALRFSGEHAMIRVDSQKRGVEFFDDQKQTPQISALSRTITVVRSALELIR